MSEITIDVDAKQDIRPKSEQFIDSVAKKAKGASTEPQNLPIVIVRTKEISSGFFAAASIYNLDLFVGINIPSFGGMLNLPSTKNSNLGKINSYLIHAQVNGFKIGTQDYSGIVDTSDSSFTIPIYISFVFFNQNYYYDLANNNQKFPFIEPVFCLNMGNIVWNKTIERFQFPDKLVSVDISKTIETRNIVNGNKDFSTNPEKMIEAEFQYLLNGERDLQCAVIGDTRGLSSNNFTWFNNNVFINSKISFDISGVNYVIQ